jgi:hypothetical protein
MIDAVYTWVDCNDPLWQMEYKQSLPSTSLKPSMHLCRFRDYGEIYYSLLSLEKFAPWIHKIFIVKKSYQSPNLKDLSQRTQNKIVWIDEAILAPPELQKEAFYPTFNSLAIEANLHRIPGLSDQFIYFNNDMFLGKPVPADYFFIGNKVRFSLRQQTLWVQCYKKLFGTKKMGLIRGHSRHLMNSHEWFSKQVSSVKTLGVYKQSMPIHQCTPLLKSGYHFAWDHVEIRKKLLMDSTLKFRAEHQLHPVYLVSLINLWSGKAHLVVEHDVFIQLGKRNYAHKLTNLTQQRAFRFCVNDSARNKHHEETMNEMTQFMHQYFYHEPNSKGSAREGI